LVRQQQKATATPKTKPSGEEKTGLLAPAHSCSPNQLDTADFLIDGLTSGRAYGAVRREEGGDELRLVS
jgi:hypothetical protein